MLGIEQIGCNGHHFELASHAALLALGVYGLHNGREMDVAMRDLLLGLVQQLIAQTVSALSVSTRASLVTSQRVP